MPFSSANFLKSATGSEPADKTKIKGVMVDESSKHLAKSKGGAITNYLPNLSVTKF